MLRSRDSSEEDVDDSSDGFPMEPTSLVSKISSRSNSNYVARESTIEAIKDMQR